MQNLFNYMLEQYRAAKADPTKPGEAVPESIDEYIAFAFSQITAIGVQYTGGDAGGFYIVLNNKEKLYLTGALPNSRGNEPARSLDFGQNQMQYAPGHTGGIQPGQTIPTFAKQLFAPPERNT